MKNNWHWGIQEEKLLPPVYESPRASKAGAELSEGWTREKDTQTSKVRQDTQYRDRGANTLRLQVMTSNLGQNTGCVSNPAELPT